MEMSGSKPSGYTRVVRRRAFTKWVNTHLSERFLAINDLVDLADCFFTIQLLEIITRRNVAIKYDGEQPVRIKRIDGWRNIAWFLQSEDFPCDLSDEDLERLSCGSVDALLAFVWTLIELFLINPCKNNITMLGKTQSSARKFLLSWLTQKLPHRVITNFNDDWKDGRAICELVNSLQPGSIPEKSFNDKDNGEANAKLGIQVAYDKFGIPKIISAFDVASSHIDELSIMTYIALFCKYETLTKSDGNNNKKLTLKEEENLVPCKAYGSGLKSGELGKIAEFIVELNGAKASDITIAIKCKPTTGGCNEKPELSVKGVGKATYVVKYLPAKQGEYIISVLHCGVHILRSPFHLTVTGYSKVNGTTPDLLKKSVEDVLTINEKLHETPLPTYKSMKESKSFQENGKFLESKDKTPDQERQESAGILVSHVRDIPLGIPMNSAEGPGLVAGEVGRVGKFTVITDNSTKGPLSVCINCPAVSIPVPYVKSEKKSRYTEHRVLYIPTEPGTYEIFITWGEQAIRGSPFKVFINDVSKDVDVSQSNATNGAEDDLGGKGKIRVYYAATSIRSKVLRDKELLEVFLNEKGILSRSDFDSWIPLDVGMTKAQREKVFKKAGHRSTPILFVDDRYIGTYEDVVIMDREGLFDSCLDYE